MKSNNHRNLNKFKTVKKLIEKGMQLSHAEAIGEAIFELQNFKQTNAVTKNDIDQIMNSISQIHNEIEKLELRMLIKLGSLLALALSLMATITHNI